MQRNADPHHDSLIMLGLNQKIPGCGSFSLLRQLYSASITPHFYTFLFVQQSFHQNIQNNLFVLLCTFYIILQSRGVLNTPDISWVDG